MSEKKTKKYSCMKMRVKVKNIIGRGFYNREVVQD